MLTCYSNVFCLVQYEIACSGHLSVLRMNQTVECATKRVFGEVIDLLAILKTNVDRTIFHYNL